MKMASLDRLYLNSAHQGNSVRLNKLMELVHNTNEYIMGIY